MIDFDLTFPHSYDIEEIGDFPGTGKFPAPLHYIPPPKGRPEHAGLWLKIKAENGEAWIGVFAFGYTSPPALTRVISTPRLDYVCVVSRGGAYVVKAEDPIVWEEIPIIPILDARIIPENNLIVFSSFTELAAYDNRGLAWRSPRLCWDNLRIVTVTDETIEGVGYDPTNPPTSEMNFVVDLKTGRSLLPPRLGLQ